MTVAIYSAIYGDYEATAKRLPVDLDVPAIMLTDNEQIAERAPHAGWTVVFDASVHGYFEDDPTKGDPAITRPMLAHKWWKTHPGDAMAAAGLPDVDVTIWLDGSMEILLPGPEFVVRNLAALGDDDWACVPHPARSCIYPEAAYSATLTWRYDGPAITRQAEFYRNVVGHPANWGLFATGHCVRRHTDAVLEVGRRWWDECVNWSHQDQLSLPVLFEIYSRRIRWNANLPWHEWWKLHPHGA